MDEVTEPKCGCMAAALRILGDRWSGLIIRELTIGPRRFGALQNALPGISPRTLSQRLDSLESESIVTRKTYAESPPRVEYSLTSKGEDLIPILRSMIEWGDRYSAVDEQHP